MDLERELVRLVRRIRPGLIGATRDANANLDALATELASSPARREALTLSLTQYLLGRDFLSALTETGLALESGMFSEILRRLEYKILPKPVDDADILGSLRRVLDPALDGPWLETIDRRRFGALLGMILPPRRRLLDRFAPQVLMALEILGLRLAGLGFEPLVARRLGSRPDLQRAFMDVARGVHSCVERGAGEIAPLRADLIRCAGAVGFIRERRAVDGVSLALTYRLAKMREVIGRLGQIVDLVEVILTGDELGWDERPARDLFFAIVLAEMRRFELRRFVADNVELLAFQITEHTGRAGEHYITRTRAEWAGMFRSAALGGAIVAFIAIVKITAAALYLAPLPEALAYSLIYAGGFVFLHTMGATLATKQPAMTASTLAAALDESEASHPAMEALSEVIVRTVRSQLVAVLGNFGVAFPVAVALAAALGLVHANPMSADKAAHTLQSLHVLRSLSLLYAAIAGVCLFASGLLAGAADNWFVFNQVGQRLRRSPALAKFVGEANLGAAAEYIDRNLGFWVGNVCLGFLLGGMGALGQVTGLPLDIRHITFASAQFGVALTTLKFAVAPKLAAWVAASIFMMGMVNLAVSFTLTMLVVVKSRRIRFRQTPLLLAKVGRRLARRPHELLFPPRDAA